MKRIILSVLMAFILVMPCFAIEENFCNDEYGNSRDCYTIYLEKMAEKEEMQKQTNRQNLGFLLYGIGQKIERQNEIKEYYHQQRVLHSMPQTYNLNIRSY
jgi:hypothetical protein